MELSLSDKQLEKNDKNNFQQIKLESLRSSGNWISDLSHITFVYYDTQNFMNSRLLNRQTEHL